MFVTIHGHDGHRPLTEGQRISTAELLELLKAPQVELGRFESTRAGRGGCELLLGDGRTVTVVVADTS